MERIPVFAVVGRTNKGKSSIVATLAESESVRISADPGTTQEAERYDVRVGERTVLAIVDTPGFQEAPSVLRWLKQRERTAASRPEVVAEFVHQFTGSGEFADECRLLAPIVEGARILYVVDATGPYRPNYEAEMEILQWTGQARMALINPRATDEYVGAWRTALDQYFNIVRVFNAHHTLFEDRIALLRAFRELDREGVPAIDEAITSLEEAWEERRRRGAGLIADLLVYGLTHYEERLCAEGEDPLRDQDQWVSRFQEAFRRKERRERVDVEALYEHDRIVREEADLERPLFEHDLFAEHSWRVLGLSTWELVRAGTLAGAAVGGAIDLGVGGASFLAGSVIGGVVGGVSTYLGGRRVAQVKILGQQLGGDVVRVGPIRNENFPWILLDRALLHDVSIVCRPHALRDPLRIEHGAAIGPEGRGPVSKLDDSVRHRFGSLFAEIRKHAEAVPHDLRERLEDEVVVVLEQITPRGEQRG